MIKYPYRGQKYADPAGWLTRHPKPFLWAMLRDMIRVRLVELEIERRYKEDEMKTPIHLVIGQEACAVGCAAALRPPDLVYAGHRNHGIYLAKGGDLKSMMAELYCRSTGCVGSRGGSMHLIDKKAGMAWTSAIVAGSIPIAAGAALAAQMKKEDRVIVAFFGDAANEEGVTSETLNFSVLKHLPLVFFSENNFYSVQSSLEGRQPSVEIHRRAAGFRPAGGSGGWNNVVAVFEAMSRAVERAREGRGPTFIEARTYRWRAHGGAGDDSPSGYRDPAEVEAWRAVCPIEGFEEALRSAGVFSKGQRAEWDQEIHREIQDAFEFARQSPEPSAADAFTHVYAE
ncbi:MAG: thiamine pyrophosphate-dependent dehydrogenase E1 component subunit alpha [Elusimicrobia bacterium]|nr:thiamine pyrophosphate-dependent dehydrogenase E1 component subunit alpha [Elusimicrobiota bacterium]